MAEEIIDRLQNMRGQTLGEYFKSLNLLIKNSDSDIRPYIDCILEQFLPKNDLEKIVMVKLIDNYKCVEAVLNILKSDDVFLTSHVLRCFWFFSRSDLDPHKLVDNIFPCMSYSTRLKVLTRYAKFLKDTNFAEKLFTALKERYGLQTAIIVLPACGENFVSEIFMTIRTQIPISLLLIVLDIHPFAALNYIKYLLECHSTNKRIFRNFRMFDYEKAFHVCASKWPNEFVLMVEKFHPFMPHLRLGRRCTKRLLSAEFNSIKKNINMYKRFINWKYLGCLTMKEIEEVHFALLPTKMSDFLSYFNNCNDYMLVLRKIKKEKRVKFLMDNFRKTYNKDITDCISGVNLELLELLPEDVREMWIELKLLHVDNITMRADYISFMSIEKSVPTLKSMIENQNDVHSRAHIVTCLLKTIKINSSWKSVGQVCQYLVKRFRNDQNIVLGKIISELCNFNKDLLQISNEDWAYIEELMNIIILNSEEKRPHYFGGDIEKLLSLQILSRYQRELPTETYLQKLFKFCDSYYDFKVCENTPYEKQCLIWFVENISQKLTNQTEFDHGTQPVIQLIKQLTNWNYFHKNDRIHIPIWMLQKIQTVFDNKRDDYHKESVFAALKKDKAVKYSLYDEIFPKYCSNNILLYKLKHDPVSMVTNVQEVVRAMYENYFISYSSFLKQAKLYSYLNLPEMISKVCLDNLQGKCFTEESFYGSKRISIRILSILLPTHKFIEVISEFYPKEKTIGDYSDESREMFSIRSEISACLKVVNSPCEILDPLRKFAVGDYLKLVVGSINSLCLRIPEYKILTLLQEWLDCPVSLRKHFIRGLLRVAPIKQSLEIIGNLYGTEKNTSLRHLLFDHCFGYFIKEPSSETFSTLEGIIKKSVSNEITHEKLYRINNIPDDFLSEYLQLLWELVSNKDDELLAKKSKNKIIMALEPTVLRVLKDDFCDMLIVQVFATGAVTDLALFLVQILFYSRNYEEMNRRIEKVMTGIRQLTLTWNTFDLKTSVVFKSRKELSCVVDNLASQSFRLDSDTLPPFDLLNKFRDKLVSIFNVEDILEEILLLDITMYFHKHKENSDMLHFSKFIVPMLEKHTSFYDANYITEIVCSILKKIFSWKFTDQTLNNENHIYLSEILISSSTKSAIVLGLRLLPMTVTSDVARYKKILDFILEHKDKSLQIFINKLCKNLSSIIKYE